MDRPYRLVKALRFGYLTPAGRGSFVVRLNRHGLPLNNHPECHDGFPIKATDHRTGRVSDKLRTIDLRPGDFVYRLDGPVEIAAVAVVEQKWLTAEEASTCREGGYLYRHKWPKENSDERANLRTSAVDQDSDQQHHRSRATDSRGRSLALGDPFA